MLPSKFPLQTSRYDHYWKHFQSAEFIKHICSVDWDISTYEGKGDPKNIAELDLLPEFKITDPRLTWFSKITDDYHFKQLINLSKERAVDVVITRLRQKIEPDPKNPIYLQTVRGNGYVLWAD